MLTKNKSLLPCLLAATLILPVNICLIGEEGLGAGLRFPLFLYQDTIYGASLIPVWREISYAASGIIGGRSALSILLWVLGTALLLAAAGYLVYRWHDNDMATRRPLALLTAGGAVAYLLSCIAQYGFTLHGPAGLAIPVGVPLIFAIAVYILKAEGMDDEPEYEDEEEDIRDEMEEE